jgi:hypothetical protein
MAPTIDRQTFRETVALVAAQAKAKLPQAVNGRIEAAAKLVLWQDVEPQDDGSILVGSSSDPGKQYRLVGTACECQDFTRGQAPEGWCQHRIAAGIHKRVQQLLAATPEPEPVLPEGMEPWPDNEWPDDEPLAPAPTPPAVPLPEAPASVNVRLTISGRECQVTLRDTDEARLLVRLEELLQRYPLPEPFPPPWREQPPARQELSSQQHNAAAMHKAVSGFCAVHNVEMKLNHGKDGRTWYSHFDDQAGRWCKGK